jgi:hypothetical protein
METIGRIFGGCRREEEGGSSTGNCKCVSNEGGPAGKKVALTAKPLGSLRPSYSLHLDFPQFMTSFISEPRRSSNVISVKLTNSTSTKLALKLENAMSGG